MYLPSKRVDDGAYKAVKAVSVYIPCTQASWTGETVLFYDTNKKGKGL